MIRYNICVPRNEGDGDVLYCHFHSLLTTSNTGVENFNLEIVSEQLKDEGCFCSSEQNPVLHFHGAERTKISSLLVSAISPNI